MFIGVWPDGDVREALAALPRPDDRRVRWTPPDQWHVTLQFLGEVDDEYVDGIAEHVREVAAGFAPRRVTLGPATRVLGRGVLVVPAQGVDDVAAAFSDEPFTGHLTLARSSERNGRIPPELAGVPVSVSWEVDVVALIRSHLGGGPAHYETVATAPFARSRGAFAP